MRGRINSSGEYVRETDSGTTGIRGNINGSGEYVRPQTTSTSTTRTTSATAPTVAVSPPREKVRLISGLLFIGNVILSIYLGFEESFVTGLITFFISAAIVAFFDWLASNDGYITGLIAVISIIVGAVNGGVAGFFIGIPVGIVAGAIIEVICDIEV